MNKQTNKGNLIPMVKREAKSTSHTPLAAMSS